MSHKQHSICLLLGSNIEPVDNLPRAVGLLQTYVTILQTSSVWESEAIGSDGPNFLNAAVLALTPLDVGKLKDAVIRPLEAKLGRVRTEDKNAPRPIDIDLIIYDNQVVDPSLRHHAYCAVPVAEILPGFQLETTEYLKDIALALDRSTPVRVRSDVSLYPFSTVFKK